MATGRYTAFQFFSSRAFPEADAAGTESYRGEQYQCPHSQRAPQFMFSDASAKQHFDAAVSTCCNQRVTPFLNRPQYADEGAPMQATRCPQTAATGRCNQVEISPISSLDVCAGSSHPIDDIRVFCPTACEDLAALKDGTSVTTSRGTFSLISVERADEWQISFTPDPALLRDHYERCLGSVSYSEDICDGFLFEWTAHAGLNSPNGCFCDCCGAAGKFPAPSGAIYWGGGAPTWEATLAPYEASIEGCPGGTMYGHASLPLGGFQGLTWLAGPSYRSNSTGERYIVGTPASVGSTTNPACCGMTLTITGTTGCGGSNTVSRTIARKAASPSWSPAGGSVLTAGVPTTIRMVGSCNSSAFRWLDFASAGIDESAWQGVSYGTVGEMRQILGAVAFSNDFASKGCCGNGVIAAAYNDGCNLTGSTQWTVKNAPSNPTVIVGSVLRCQQVGLNYRVYKTGLRCDGQEEGSWSELSPTNYATVAACVQAIDSASDTVITGACASSTHCPAAGDCCLYGNNGQSSTSFRAFLFCVNDSDWSSSPTCCSYPYSTGLAWVTNSSGTCCPN